MENEENLVLTDEAIMDRIFGLGVDSINRAEQLLSILNGTSDEKTFWRAVNIGYGCCDAMSPETQTWLGLNLERMSCDFVPYLDEADQIWWSSVKPNPQLVVYRGCERDRIESLSWTICPKVAAEFARGHRGISLKDPVIAKMMVTSDDILFATNGREEQEVLISFSVGEYELSYEVTDYVEP